MKDEEWKALKTKHDRITNINAADKAFRRGVMAGTNAGFCAWMGNRALGSPNVFGQTPAWVDGMLSALLIVVCACFYMLHWRDNR